MGMQSQPQVIRAGLEGRAADHDHRRWSNLAGRRNVFVIGLNDFNLAKLRTITNAERYNFIPLLDPAELYEAKEFDIPDMLRRAEAAIDAFEGPVHGIPRYIDFPVSTMLPILCDRFDLRTPSLESVLKCEHKYWSRLEQQKVVPRHIPGFQAFDPFDDEPIAAIPFDFPFWIKPIKSSGSRLGFRINRKEEFDEAIGILREQIGAIEEPFNAVLEHVQLPPEIEHVAGHYCIAEEIIGGRQCTLEGWALDGEVDAIGIVDSIRYPNNISFFRYQYPSKLPARIRRRMVDITRKVIRHIGLDATGFNVEYYWEEQTNHIWLLEINTRISQSHCDLFEKVDGASHHEIAVDMALGQRPDFPRREGAYPLAAKFFHRVWEDGWVRRVPTEDEVAEIEAKYPGTIIELQVSDGMRLSDLPEEDSYSFAVACIYMGARTQSALLKKYERVVRALDFRFEPVEQTGKFVV